MQPESGIKTWQWVVTVIVIIVLIVIGFMIFGNKGATVPAPTDQSDNSNANTPGANSIVMSDQYPGNVVYISSVQLTAPGWVAIHEDNKGQPGAIIGETYVAAGINPARVTVSKAIVDGGTYYAMLHSDDGDLKFDATKDLPLKDASGNVIMRVFHGSSAAGANIKG